MHIKQIRGGDNIASQVHYVQENLNGKISFENNTINFHVPIKLVSTAGDYSNLDEESLPSKKYTDEQIELLKGNVSEFGDTLEELENTIKNLPAVSATAVDVQNADTEIGSITIGDSTYNFKLSLAHLAPIDTPYLKGEPRAVSPDIRDVSHRIATTEFVRDYVAKYVTDKQAGTMETIAEVSQAINNDKTYYLTMLNQLNSKLNTNDIAVTSPSEKGTVVGQISIQDQVTTFMVDLEPYAKLSNPEFEGEPTVPTAPSTAITVKPLQIANVRYVDGAIRELRGTPPDQLNTLQKIADAINNNTTFATDVQSAIDGKQPLNSVLTNLSNVNIVQDQILYTTNVAGEFAGTAISAQARTLLSNKTAKTMRATLETPSTTGEGANGDWDINILGTAAKATSALAAVNDSESNPIATTYMKIADYVEPDLSDYVKRTEIENVSVVGTLQKGDTIATVKVGNKDTDIKVDLSAYLTKVDPDLQGNVTAPTLPDGEESDKVATTRFVSNAIKNLASGMSAENLEAIASLAEELNSNGGAISELITALNDKQPRNDALTSISGLTTAANMMLYTEGSNQYRTTTFTNLAKSIVASETAADARIAIGALGKTDKIDSAISADSATSCTGNAATATNATNDSEGQKISTTYVKVSKIKEIIAPGSLEWTNATDEKGKIPSLNTLAYWNGQVQSGVSNLAYCKQGAFGTIVTKNVGDYLTKEEADNYYSPSNYTFDFSDFYNKSEADSTFLKKDEKAASATTADSANEAASCTGNAASATKLLDKHNFVIKDNSSTNTGTIVQFDGTNDVTLLLPSNIQATLNGNASSATKLSVQKTITIKDNSESNSSGAVTFDGTKDIIIKLPATIKASIDGNAATATKATSADACSGISNKADRLTNLRTFMISNSDGTNTTTGSTFNGEADVTLKLPSIIRATLEGSSTSCTGNAKTATSLETAMKINGFNFNGSSNISSFARCTTASGTKEKIVNVSDNFVLTEGSRVTVLFAVTNTASGPTLNVNSTGAKPIIYRGTAIATNAIQQSSIYDFIYYSSQWHVVGSIVWTD